MTINLRPLLAYSICVICGTSSLTASTITWGASQDVTGDLSEISNNGVLASALNVHGPATVANGVSFTRFVPSEWGNNNYGNGLSGGSTGDDAYNDLLNSARATAGTFGDGLGPGNPTETAFLKLSDLATLIPGHNYEIQLWYCDQRTSAAPATNILYDRVMTFSSSDDPSLTVSTTGWVTNSGSIITGPSVALEADPNNDTSTIFGQFVTGTFTADGDDLYLLIVGSNPNPNNTASLRPHLNALQIRDLDATPPEAVPVGHYWDFDTLDPSTLIPIDRYGTLTTTEVGLTDLSTNPIYGEAFAGAGWSFNSSHLYSDYLVAETHDGGTATALDFGMESFAISYWSYNATSDEDPKGAMVFDCVAGTAAGGLQLGTIATGVFNLRINDVDGNSVISNNVPGFENVTQPADQWVHVTLNVDRTNNLLSIFFNGVAIPEGSISISSLTGKITCSQDLQLGARDGTTQLCALDDFAIYPQILSAQQITDLANATATPLDLLASFETSADIPVVSTALDGTTGEFTMIFTSKAGKTYSVFGGSDLADISSWPELTVSDINGDDTDLSYSHIAGETRFFYQVRED